MRYCSFNASDYLLLEHLPPAKNLSLLEIGVGLGTLAEKLRGRVKEYCAVDISRQLIDYLSSLYHNLKCASWHCLDVCKESSSLRKNFDIIFSYHTLEHVSSPQGFFNFVSRHTKPNGIIFVIFPNQSQEKHHGITWFNTKKELLRIIEGAQLKIIKFLEIRETTWHRVVRLFLWSIPKAIISRSEKMPQTFEETDAFKIAQADNVTSKVLGLYANMVTKLAAIFPLYKYSDVGEDIKNKELFIFLKHK